MARLCSLDKSLTWLIYFLNIKLMVTCLTHEAQDKIKFGTSQIDLKLFKSATLIRDLVVGNGNGLNNKCKLESNYFSQKSISPIFQQIWYLFYQNVQALTVVFLHFLT